MFKALLSFFQAPAVQIVVVAANPVGRHYYNPTAAQRKELMDAAKMLRLCGRINKEMRALRNNGWKGSFCAAI